MPDHMADSAPPRPALTHPLRACAAASPPARARSLLGADAAGRRRSWPGWRRQPPARRGCACRSHRGCWEGREGGGWEGAERAASSRAGQSIPTCVVRSGSCGPPGIGGRPPTLPQPPLPSLTAPWRRHVGTKAGLTANRAPVSHRGGQRGSPPRPPHQLQLGTFAAGAEWPLQSHHTRVRQTGQGAGGRRGNECMNA